MVQAEKEKRVGVGNVRTVAQTEVDGRTAMKTPTEAQLMELETRLDRINNESRAALGLVRRLLEYHKPNRQKTVLSYLDRPSWLKHQKDLRDGCPDGTERTIILEVE